MSKCRYGCDELNTREHEQECMAKHLKITFERLLMLEERFKEKENITMVTRTDATEETVEMMSSLTISSALSATAKPFIPAASPASVVKATVAVDDHRVRGIAGVLDWTVVDFSRKRQVNAATEGLHEPYKLRCVYKY